MIGQIFFKKKIMNKEKKKTCKEVYLMERTQQRINLSQLKWFNYFYLSMLIYTLIYTTALSNEADLVSILLS